jgi:y4mF family transcriptional regulator
MKAEISTKGIRSISSDLDAIGRAVRDARRRHGMTQIDLAGLSGTSQRFISQLENGVRNVTLSKVLDVLAVLGLRLDVTGTQT